MSDGSPCRASNLAACRMSTLPCRTGAKINETKFHKLLQCLADEHERELKEARDASPVGQVTTIYETFEPESTTRSSPSTTLPMPRASALSTNPSNVPIRKSSRASSVNRSGVRSSTISAMSCLSEGRPSAMNLVQPAEIINKWGKTRSERSFASERSSFASWNGMVQEESEEEEEVLEEFDPDKCVAWDEWVKTKSASGTRGFATCRGHPSSDLATVASACMLDPNSKRAMTWDFLGACFLAVDMMLIPFEAAFSHDLMFRPCVEVASALYWTMDMAVTLRTGFYEDGDVVTSPSRVFWHYAYTWLLLDVLIVFSAWVVVSLEVHGNSVVQFLRLVRYVKFLRLIRIFKVKKLSLVIEESLDSEVAMAMFALAGYGWTIIILCHWLACAWYAIGYVEDEKAPNWTTSHNLLSKPVAERYTVSLWWAVTMTGLGSTNVYPASVAEHLFATFLVVCALLFVSSLVALITSSVLTIHKMRNDQWRQRWLVRKFLHCTAVSSGTASRVQRHIAHMMEWSEKNVTEDQVQILTMLSTPLRSQLKLESYMPHLGGHLLFACYQHMLAGVVANSCTPVPASEGDIVFECDNKAKSALVIINGTLSYWIGVGTSKGPELLSDQKRGYDLFEGDWIAEAVLWMPWQHMGDLEATTVSQLLLIDSKLWRSAVVDNAPLLQDVQRFAKQYVEEVRKLSKDMCNDIMLVEQEKCATHFPRSFRPSSSRGRRKSSSVSFDDVVCK